MGVLDGSDFFSPTLKGNHGLLTFINLTFRFSPMVKYKNLDYKKSEMFKHPSFRYLPMVKYGNLDFKNLRFPKIRLFNTRL